MLNCLSYCSKNFRKNDRSIKSRYFKWIVFSSVSLHSAAIYNKDKKSVRRIRNTSAAISPWKWCHSANSLIFFENRSGLLPSFPHVVLHSVEFRHGSPIWLPRRPFNHIASIFWSPECWVAIMKEQPHLNISATSEKKKNYLWEFQKWMQPARKIS